jgi:hypothetical protein
VVPDQVTRRTSTSRGPFLHALRKDTNLIDGCTEGKSREPLHWLFKELSGKVVSDFTADDIL